MSQPHQRFRGGSPGYPDVEYLRHLAQIAEEDSLSPGDVAFIRNWLRRAPEPLSGDWEPIAAGLERQGQTDLANDIRSLLDESEHQLAVAVERVSALGTSPTWAMLVGAGGSRPAPSEIPTVRELLPQLWKKAGEINAPSLLRLKSRCEELGISNIEDLLTAISISQSVVSNTKVAMLIEDLLFAEPRDDRRIGPGGVRNQPRRFGPDLVGSLSESSQMLFSLLVGMMRDKEPNAVHRAINERVVLHPNDTIITTNYDVCIERALGEGQYNYELEPLSSEKDKSRNTILLKLHGSLSWYACKNCDRYITATLRQVNETSTAGLYPIVSMCPKCAATAQQLIIPPIGMKYAEHPVLLDMRQRAEKAFASASVIVIVGYSFSEADQYVLRMLSRSLDSVSPPRAVVVFDRDTQPAKRLGQYLQTHTNFNSENVLAVTGHAEDTFPEFVRSVSSAMEDPGNGSADRPLHQSSEVSST